MPIISPAHYISGRLLKHDFQELYRSKVSWISIHLKLELWRNSFKLKNFRKFENIKLFDNYLINKIALERNHVFKVEKSKALINLFPS